MTERARVRNGLAEAGDDVRLVRGRYRRRGRVLDVALSDNEDILIVRVEGSGKRVRWCGPSCELAARGELTRKAAEERYGRMAQVRAWAEARTMSDEALIEALREDGDAPTVLTHPVKD